MLRNAANRLVAGTPWARRVSAPRSTGAATTAALSSTPIERPSTEVPDKVSHAHNVIGTIAPLPSTAATAGATAAIAAATAATANATAAANASYTFNDPNITRHPRPAWWWSAAGSLDVVWRTTSPSWAGRTSCCSRCAIYIIRHLYLYDLEHLGVIIRPVMSATSH